jgi:hypothetical protein
MADTAARPAHSENGKYLTGPAGALPARSATYRASDRALASSGLRGRLPKPPKGALDSDVRLTPVHALGSVWFEPHAARPDQHGAAAVARSFRCEHSGLTLARGLATSAELGGTLVGVTRADRGKGKPDVRCELHRVARAARGLAPVRRTRRSGIRCLPLRPGRGPLSKLGRTLPAGRRRAAYPADDDSSPRHTRGMVPVRRGVARDRAADRRLCGHDARR